MRVEFVDTVAKVMQSDEKALFLSGDLGFNAFEGLQKSFGPRFLNVGVAEQNMIGVAAGMALEGYRPWAYSIAPFAVYRCLEQIRNDVCLHKLPVHIAGNGGGFTYGIMGATHHALEDMAVLKALPNMRLYFPCTNNQVEAAVRQIAATDGPTYLRLGFSGYPMNVAALRENAETLTRVYSEGGDVVVVGIGQGVQIALKALDSGILDRSRVSVFGIARFPFEVASDPELFSTCARAKRVIVIEEHYRSGGIAESLRLALPTVRDFRLMAPEYSLDHRYGSPAFHLKQAGMTPEILGEWANLSHDK
jgi:transketolase